MHAGVPALAQRVSIGGKLELVPRLLEYARAGAVDRFPHFVRGEREDRREQSREALGDVIQRVLRRAPGRESARACRADPSGCRGRSRRGPPSRTSAASARRDGTRNCRSAPGCGIPVAELGRRERALKIVRHHERVTVDLEPLVHGQRVALDVEVGEIREQEPQRVANAPIGFDDALQDLFRDRQLARVIGRRHPQAQDVRAELVHHLLRRDDVALRLAHLVPGAIDKEAVGEQRAIRRNAVRHAGDEKRRVKPAAMLVGAFEIQIRRERAFVLVRSAQHGEMRRIRSRTTRRACLSPSRSKPRRPRSARRGSSVCHASSPPCSTRRATSSRSSSVRGCSSPVSLRTKNGIGTPHCRCRDIVQSGRLAIIPAAAPCPRPDRTALLQRRATQSRAMALQASRR